MIFIIARDRIFCVRQADNARVEERICYLTTIAISSKNNDIHIYHERSKVISTIG